MPLNPHRLVPQVLLPRLNAKEEEEADRDLEQSWSPLKIPYPKERVKARGAETIPPKMQMRANANADEDQKVKEEKAAPKVDQLTSMMLRSCLARHSIDTRHL